MKPRRILGGIFVLLEGLAYGTVLRFRMLRWGATDEEVRMSLPGDKIAVKADYKNTLAITVNASPQAIWPWVVQMGQDRAGFYTYTWLENLFFADMHNADRIVPEWQQRAVGDFVSTFRGKMGWNIAELVPNQALVYGDKQGGTIAVVIKPINNQSSRLLLRLRLVGSRNLLGWLFERMFWDWAHSVMGHGLLEGIKERVEKTEIS